MKIDENGGNISFSTYDELSCNFELKENGLHPLDLKNGKREK